ncbi:MAG: hypothetical protein K2X48_02970 [Chitinophagaceae bacterium]|nr:hypothetical protein [Chitinophagaceae bacterium]
MKHLIFFFTFVFTAMQTDAQIDTSKKLIQLKPVYQMQRTFQTIPSPKAVLVRSDAFKLKNEMMQFRDSIAVTRTELDRLIKEVDTKLDNLSAMDEMESLRLQMAMDRLSKMMSTLSNLMRKMSETQQNITQNLK